MRRTVTQTDKGFKQWYWKGYEGIIFERCKSSLSAESYIFSDTVILILVKSAKGSANTYDEPTERPQHGYDLPGKSASTSVSLNDDYTTEAPAEPDSYDEPTERPQHSYEPPEKDVSASVDYETEPPTEPSDHYSSDSATVDTPSETDDYGYSYGYESSTLSGGGKGKGGKGKGGKGKGGKTGKRQ